MSDFYLEDGSFLRLDNILLDKVLSDLTLLSERVIAFDSAVILPFLIFSQISIGSIFLFVFKI